MFFHREKIKLKVSCTQKQAYFRISPNTNTTNYMNNYIIILHTHILQHPRTFTQRYFIIPVSVFSRRKRGQDVNGFPGVKKDKALDRVYNVHPTQTECYYLKILLQHVRGPMTFEEFKAFNGIILQTYQGACKRLDLLKGDQH